MDVAPATRRKLLGRKGQGHSQADADFRHNGQRVCDDACHKTEHNWQRVVIEPTCSTRLVILTYVKSTESRADNVTRIGEKFLEWTDEDPSLDDILTNVNLYWFTESYARSIYPYRMKVQDHEFHKRPVGFSLFPHEALLGLKQVVEQGGNLVSYKRHESGGHFAALEKPKELWADVEEFVAIAWKE